MFEKYEELRLKEGVTNSKISQETGIPQSTFSDWKKGRSVPKVDKLMKLANFFGVPLETFLAE